MKTTPENHTNPVDDVVIPTFYSFGNSNKDRIAELRDKFSYLTDCFFKGITPERSTTQTDILDDYFQNSFAGSSTGIELDPVSNPYAIIARGNYGRKEICCQPNVNILFIFSTTIPEKADGLIKDIIYPLWDLDLNITYSIRTVGECIVHARENYTYLLSVLDSRFVCGASLLFSQLINTIREKVVFNRKKEITAWQFEQDKKRHEHYNSMEYLLEPDLIFSKGGLNDLHSIISIGKATLNFIDPVELNNSEILSETEYETLENAIAFIRNVVRFLNITNRRSSRLLVKHQYAAATFMKYKNTRDRSCTDLFLSDLYEHMNNVRKIHNRFYLFVSPRSFAIKKTTVSRPPHIADWLSSANGLISFKSSKKITRKPLRLLSIFSTSEKLGMPLNSTAIRMISEHLPFLTDKTVDQKKACDLLEQNLFSSETNSAVPFSMLDSGILTTLIPELSYAVNKKTAGYYHFQPFCHHLLLTLKHLKEIFYESNELYVSIVQNSVSIGGPHSIFWAALLHDLEPAVAEEVLKRFGKSAYFIEEVCFLAKNYTLLYDIVSRGKIFGDKTIRSYAARIKSYQQLNRLYCLTLASMRARGSFVCNDYRIKDLAELYHKIIESRFDKKTPAKTQEVTISTIRQLCSFHKTANPEALISSIDLKKFQETFSHDELFQHLKINAETGTGGIGFFHETTKKIRKTTLLSKSPACSLSSILGVLLENRIRIYDYRGFSYTDHICVHTFRSERDRDRMFENEKWARVESRLQTAAPESDEVFYQKEPAFSGGTNDCFTERAKVKIARVNTDQTLVIEIVSNDRPELLYKVVNRLLTNELQVIFFRKTEESKGCLYIFQITDSSNSLGSSEAKKELSTQLLREITHEAG